MTPLAWRSELKDLKSQGRLRFNLWPWELPNATGAAIKLKKKKKKNVELEVENVGTEKDILH